MTRKFIFVGHRFTDLFGYLGVNFLLVVMSAHLCTLWFLAEYMGIPQQLASTLIGVVVIFIVFNLVYSITAYIDSRAVAKLLDLYRAAALNPSIQESYHIKGAEISVEFCAGSVVVYTSASPYGSTQMYGKVRVSISGSLSLGGEMFTASDEFDELDNPEESIRNMFSALYVMAIEPNSGQVGTKRSLNGRASTPLKDALPIRDTELDDPETVRWDLWQKWKK